MTSARSVEAAAAPIMLCLNLRKEWVREEDRTAPWAETAKLCLTNARLQGWTIIHIHQERAIAARERGSLEGAEPLREESVYIGPSRSALDWLKACDASGDCALVHLIGVAYSRAGLALATAAHEMGRPIILISDACGNEPGASSLQARGFAARLQAPLIGVLSSDYLIYGARAAVTDLQQWRLQHANKLWRPGGDD